MSAPDLLQWLLNGGKTGTLTVVHSGVQKRLLLARGAIVGASSSDPDLAFGQFLLDLGKIDEATLVSLVRKQRETGVMLGKLLTRDGILSEDDVSDVLRLKARETIFELMAWREGDFEFVEGLIEDNDSVRLEVSIDSIIFEGIRRAEQRRKIREAFPSGNLVPALLSDEARTTMLANPEAAPMVSLMDRGCSLREIARQLRLPVMDVSRVLYGYLSQGMLVVGFSSDPHIPHYYLPASDVAPRAAEEIDPVGALGVPDLVHMVELAEQFLDGAEYEEALATIERAHAMAPEDTAVAAAAARVEERYLEALRSFFGAGACTPVLAVSLLELPTVKPLLTSEEGFVATRISGGSTVAEIVSVSPLPELRTLRILRIFADAELVMLQRPADA